MVLDPGAHNPLPRRRRRRSDTPPTVAWKTRGLAGIRAVVLALTTLLGTAGAGCAPPWRDLFHVESAGARLPIVVYGPSEARTLVLFQHGGPDGAAGIDPLPPGLARLTDRALVATWAQRSTGLAAGVSRTRDNTIDQHVSDLHGVRKALQLRYPDVTRVVLAGHSWGVALTLAYVDEHGEAGLDGLVLSDGFDAYDDNAERSFARLATLAAEAAQSVDEDDAAEGDDAASWRAVERFARDEADAGAPYPLSTIVEASEACARLEAQLDRPEPAEPEPAGLGAVTSPLVVPEGLLVTWNFRTMITELMTFDRSASVAARRLPALLVWGESDCRVPVATGESLRARYGGDARLAVISGATHFALYSQPQAFATPTIEFLEELP